MADYSNVTIEVSPAGGGTTTPAAGNYPATYEIGSTLYVTARANTAGGYRYVHMLRNGLVWTPENTGEFLNLAATETITVVFEISTSSVTVTIEASPADGGTTNPSAGVHSYFLGYNLYVTATPASGYTFKEMQRNGVFHTAETTGEFLNLQAGETITVVFESTGGGGGGGGGVETNVLLLVSAVVVTGLVVGYLMLK